MKYQRLKITIEECLQMQHPFGYKVEYHDGEAVLQPQELYIDGHLILTPHKTQRCHHYEVVRTNHQQAMTEAFFNAFQDTVEFCNWPKDDIRKHAEKNIDDYFSGVRGEPNPASRLLRDKTGAITALVLFITTKSGQTKLDLLLVLPDSQRRGIAADMVASACNELQQQGISEIYSSWHVLNETSQHWHHRFGFTDVYNQYFIERKFSWYRGEIKRLESQDITEGVEELRQQKDRWYSLMDEKWQSFSRN